MLCSKTGWSGIDTKISKVVLTIINYIILQFSPISQEFEIFPRKACIYVTVDDEKCALIGVILMRPRNKFALFEIPVVHRNAKITKNSDVQRAQTSWSCSSRPCLRIELCGEQVLVSGEQRTVIKVEWGVNNARRSTYGDPRMLISANARHITATAD